jgi:hypothetical protein
MSTVERHQRLHITKGCVLCGKVVRFLWISRYGFPEGYCVEHAEAMRPKESPDGQLALVVYPEYFEVITRKVAAGA